MFLTNKTDLIFTVCLPAGPEIVEALADYALHGEEYASGQPGLFETLELLALGWLWKLRWLWRLRVHLGHTI